MGIKVITDEELNFLLDSIIMAQDVLLNADYEEERDELDESIEILAAIGDRPDNLDDMDLLT